MCVRRLQPTSPDAGCIGRPGGEVELKLSQRRRSCTRDGSKDGLNFDFEAGEVAPGFSSLVSEAMEGTAGTVPDGWFFWNRPGVGSEITARGLTSTHAASGESSFGIELTKMGDGESYTLVYRPVPIETATRYCVAVAVRSPEDEPVISLSFRPERGSAENLYERARTFLPTGDAWQKKAVCVDLPADSGMREVTIWLGMRTSEPGAHDVWFDEVELFAAP